MSPLEQPGEGLTVFRTSAFEELLYNVIMHKLSSSFSVPVPMPGD